MIQHHSRLEDLLLSASKKDSQKRSYQQKLGERWTAASLDCCLLDETSKTEEKQLEAVVA